MELLSNDHQRQGLNNFIRLSMLLEEGSELLRKIFRSRFQQVTTLEWENDGTEYILLTSLMEILGGKNKDSLNLKPLQQEMMESGDVEKWDLTTLAGILQKMSVTEEMKKDNIEILRLITVRNVYAHLPQRWCVGPEKFVELWEKAVQSLIALGGDAKCFAKICSLSISLDRDDQEEEERRKVKNVQEQFLQKICQVQSSLMELKLKLKPDTCPSSQVNGKGQSGSTSSSSAIGSNGSTTVTDSFLKKNHKVDDSFQVKQGQSIVAQLQTIGSPGHLSAHGQQMETAMKKKKKKPKYYKRRVRKFPPQKSESIAMEWWSP